MKNCKACAGCSDNFYNGNNSLGVKQCWNVPTAKLVTRYRMPTSCPGHILEAYMKVSKPDCFHERGYAFYKSIPDYAQSRKYREAKTLAVRLQEPIPSGETGPFAQPTIAVPRSAAFEAAYGL